MMWNVVDKHGILAGVEIREGSIRIDNDSIVAFPTPIYFVNRGSLYSLQKGDSEKVSGYSVARHDLGSGNIVESISTKYCIGRLTCRDHLNLIGVTNSTTFNLKEALGTSEDTESKVPREWINFLHSRYVAGEKGTFLSFTEYQIQLFLENLCYRFDTTCGTIVECINGRNVPLKKGGDIHFPLPPISDVLDIYTCSLGASSKFVAAGVIYELEFYVDGSEALLSVNTQNYNRDDAEEVNTLSVSGDAKSFRISRSFGRSTWPTVNSAHLQKSGNK